MESFRARLRLAAFAGSVHSLLLIVILGATVPTAQQCTPACLDNDKDGYGANCTAGPDCDDTNADIHPGASESADSMDQNCNGIADEGIGITVNSEYHFAYSDFGIISFPAGNLTQADAHCFSIESLYAGYDITSCPAQPELELTLFYSSYNALALDTLTRTGARQLCSTCHYLDFDYEHFASTYRLMTYANKTAVAATTTAVGVSPKLPTNCECPPSDESCPNGESRTRIGACPDQNGVPQCNYYRCVPCDSASCDGQACARYKPNSCQCDSFSPPCGPGQVFAPGGSGSCGCTDCPNTACTRYDTSHNDCRCIGCSKTCDFPKELNEDICDCECSAALFCPYGKNEDCTCKTCDLACGDLKRPNASCTACECIAQPANCVYGLNPETCQCNTCQLQCGENYYPNSSCTDCACSLNSASCPYGYNLAECRCLQCGPGSGNPCPSCPAPLRLDGQKGCVCPDGRPASDPSQCNSVPDDNCFFGSNVGNANRQCTQGSNGSWCCHCLFQGDSNAIQCCGPHQAWVGGTCVDCNGSNQSCRCDNCVSGCDLIGRCTDEEKCDSNKCVAQNTGLVTGCTFDPADCSCDGCHCTNGESFPSCGLSSSSSSSGGQSSSSTSSSSGQTSSSSSSGQYICPNGSLPGPNGECPCEGDGDCPAGAVCSDGNCVGMEHCVCIGGNHPGDGCYSDINCWHEGTPVGFCVCGSN